MKIEANTLQEAFQKAAEQLNCSVTELDIKVLQHPSGGIFGFFKKTAIIEANLENPKIPPLGCCKTFISSSVTEQLSSSAAF